MKIPMTKQQRKAYRAAKDVNPSLTRVQFVTSPEGRTYRTPEQIETPVQQFDRVARENRVDPVTGE